MRRREAEFRAKMVHEFLDRGERNTYLHVLREERAALIKREQESFADLEDLTRKLEAESARAAALEAELGADQELLGLEARGSPAGRRRALEAPGPASPAARATPRSRAASSPTTCTPRPSASTGTPRFTLRGWAWPQDGRAVTAVRVNLDGRAFDGRHGLEEPEVIARYGPQPANPVPASRSPSRRPPAGISLSLEAQLEGGRVALDHERPRSGASPTADERRGQGPLAGRLLLARGALGVQEGLGPSGAATPTWPPSRWPATRTKRRSSSPPAGSSTRCESTVGVEP